MNKSSTSIWCRTHSSGEPSSKTRTLRMYVSESSSVGSKAISKERSFSLSSSSSSFFLRSRVTRLNGTGGGQIFSARWVICARCKSTFMVLYRFGIKKSTRAICSLTEINKGMEIIENSLGRKIHRGEC